MIQALWHMRRLCTLLLARVLIAQLYILQIYHIIPPVNAHEIFS